MTSSVPSQLRSRMSAFLRMPFLSTLCASACRGTGRRTWAVEGLSPPRPKGKGPFRGRGRATVHRRGPTLARTRRGLHRGHRLRAVWAPRTHRHARANSQRKGRTERTAAAVVVLAVAGGAPTAGLGRRWVEPPGEPGGKAREEKMRDGVHRPLPPPL
jgi:hypothetical protein